MTRFLLIRHAEHDLLGRSIAGRMPGVRLNAAGRLQAQQLAERLAAAPIAAVYSGPLERALETARPLAGRMDLEVEILETLDEIDYGDWTGRSLIELEKLPRWQQYNAYRSGTRIPNGELMLEAQARIVAEMERLRDLHPEDTIALVSHGDLIKAAVACYVGAPLDLFQRIEIHPASISVLALDDHGPQLRCLNNTGELCLA